MMKNTNENTTSEVKATATAPVHNTGATLVEGDLGDVKIHENVIAALVARATLEVEGVSRLAGSTLVDAIAGIVGNRRMQSRAIAIDMSEDNRVAVEVKVNLLFGVRVPDVAIEIQKNVIANIESVTGMTVTRVNVLVQEMEEEPAEVEEDGEAGDNPATTASIIGSACPMP